MATEVKSAEPTLQLKKAGLMEDTFKKWSPQSGRKDGRAELLQWLGMMKTRDTEARSSGETWECGGHGPQYLLERKAFHWDWLSVSEAQSTVIMAGSTAVCSRYGAEEGAKSPTS